MVERADDKDHEPELDARGLGAGGAYRGHERWGPAVQQSLLEHRPEAVEFPIRNGDRLGDQEGKGGADAEESDVPGHHSEILGKLRRDLQRTTLEAVGSGELREGATDAGERHDARDVAGTIQEGDGGSPEQVAGLELELKPPEPSKIEGVHVLAGCVSPARLGGFEDSGKRCEAGVVHHVAEAVETDLSLADMFVAVEPAAEFSPGVVGVYDLDFLEANYMRKLLHCSRIRRRGADVVTGGEDVAGIEADAEPLREM